MPITSALFHVRCAMLSPAGSAGGRNVSGFQDELGPAMKSLPVFAREFFVQIFQACCYSDKLQVVGA
jgi:hypothetical protein